MKLKIRSSSGSALIVTMIYVAVLSMLVASVLVFSGGENVQIQRRNSRESSLYGAEAAIRRSMAQVQHLLVSQYPLNGYMAGAVAPASSELAALSGPTNVAALAQFSFVSNSINYVSGNATNPFVSFTIPSTSTDPLAGLTTSRATIRCRATASIASGTQTVPETVIQDLYVDYIPIFQYAIFYNMDMEAFNGPDMTINGKVHANGNFYFNNFGNLTVNDNLTVSENMIRGLKVWNPTANDWEAGTPTWNSGTGSFKVKDPQSGSTVDAKVSTTPLVYYDSTASDWETGAITKWHGGVKTQTQGIADITPPIPDAVISAATDPNNPYHVMIEKPIITSSSAATWSVSDDSDTQKAKMAFSASLIIHRSGTNVFFSVPIKDADGKVVSYKDINLKNGSQIVPASTTTVRDQREYLMDNNKISMSEVELEKLYQSMDSSGNFLDDTTGLPVTHSTAGVSDPVSPEAFNGMVYIFDHDYDGSVGTGYRPGIRLHDDSLSGGSATKNATLPSGVKGISIISENPVYVLGNFNSDGNANTAPEGVAGGSSSTNPGVESSGTGANVVKPAMIVADAVSFMSKSWVYDDGSGSSNWDDDPSMSTLWNRRVNTSSTTEVNAAIIAGASDTDPTETLSDGDGTTGGIHNYPRYMEQWASKNFKISGSMASLFFSAQSKSYFKDSGSSGKVYQPPTRLYAFNTKFLDPDNLPPGTPMVRRFANGDWTNE